MTWNMARMGRYLLLGFMLVAGETEVGAKPPSLSIDQLREQHEPSTLMFERALPPGDGYSAALFSYKSSGLKVYALVATPNSPHRQLAFPCSSLTMDFIRTRNDTASPLEAWIQGRVTTIGSFRCSTPSAGSSS